MDAPEPVEEKCPRPVMCICTATKFRPTLLSLISAYECTFCDGWGWVEEHKFTGDDVCTVCGFSEAAHWENAED